MLKPGILQTKTLQTSQFGGQADQRTDFLGWQDFISRLLMNRAGLPATSVGPRKRQDIVWRAQDRGKPRIRAIYFFC